MDFLGSAIWIPKVLFLCEFRNPECCLENPLVLIKLIFRSRLEIRSKLGTVQEYTMDAENTVVFFPFAAVVVVAGKIALVWSCRGSVGLDLEGARLGESRELERTGSK